jgi:hypothetical protein
MKRLLPFTILLVIVLSACMNRETSNPIEPTAESMVVNFKNNANFDFYGLEVAILNSSTGTVNADGSKIDKGDLVSFELLEEDFALDGEAEMNVSVIVNGQGDVVPINKKVTIELAKNQGIFFEITGDSIEEADIKSVK